MRLPHWISRAARAAALLASTALAGCHSLPALHYYALDPAQPSAAVAHPGFALLIRVRHISVPHDIDHLGLTHHLGPTRLAISDNDQWSAPLGVLIQGTFTTDLGERVGFDHVVAADAVPTGAPGAQAALDLDFVALSADDACAVSAQVNWTLSMPNAFTRRGTAHLMASAASCPAGLPAALSTALGDLADQIVPQLTVP